MGTVFSIDVCRDEVGESGVQRVVDWLHWVDTVFSTYRPDSPINRLGRGELTVNDCVPEIAEVLSLCADVTAATGGFFTAMPNGSLDPSGLVKGWAIERASDMLSAAGSTSHAVNGGGDMQLVGEPTPGRPWRVGVADPRRPGQLAAIVCGRDVAVATSGIAERGNHVRNPFTGRAATELASITLVGEHLTTVDAYATAALAMGRAARDWIETLDGYEGFAVTAEGGTWWTRDFPIDLSQSIKR